MVGGACLPDVNRGLASTAPAISRREMSEGTTGAIIRASITLYSENSVSWSTLVGISINESVGRRRWVGQSTWL